MEIVFKSYFIKGTEIIFVLFVVSIILMLIITSLFVKKELNKKK